MRFIIRFTMKKITEETFDEERALYNLTDAKLTNVTFAGLKDGESPLKESVDITLENCLFSLRYPLWHCSSFSMGGCHFDDKARAPLWYCHNGEIVSTPIEAIKCLRESKDISFKNCSIVSPEFGWKCERIQMDGCHLDSEYPFFEESGSFFTDLTLKGKYSFQHCQGCEVDRSVLETKDAFWHSRDCVIRDSIVKGEYLAWYSENLTLVNCTIVGSQPFCYCKGLKLIDCTMEGCDLAFEYSEVDAEIKGTLSSIKNPLKGTIRIDRPCLVIREDSVYPCSGQVIVRK